VKYKILVKVFPFSIQDDGLWVVLSLVQGVQHLPF